jgi:hypothetical protein
MGGLNTCKHNVLIFTFFDSKNCILDEITRLMYLRRVYCILSMQIATYPSAVSISEQRAMSRYILTVIRLAGLANYTQISTTRLCWRISIWFWDFAIPVMWLIIIIFFLRYIASEGRENLGAWTVAGFAVRLCVELRYHGKSTAREVSMEREFQVRIFWSCYYPDQSISVA